MSWTLSHHNRRFHKTPDNFEDFIPLKDYCKKQFITKKQAERLLLKGTIRGYKHGGRWWVENRVSFGVKGESAF